MPKEIKSQEYRVGITPVNAEMLIMSKHEVIVQKGAGIGSNFSDQDYIDIGGTLVDEAQEVFESSDMIVKVKEPQPNECKMLRKGQIIFAYLHLAPDEQQTRLLLESEAVAIAYETVTSDRNVLPLLAPMSAIAGRLSVQIGARYLEKSNGGVGMLLSGIYGAAPAKVVIVGAGVVGMNAARMAIGLEADVTILDKSLCRIQELNEMYSPKLVSLYSVDSVLQELLVKADLVIGSVLIPGAAAPRVITENMVRCMKKQSVFIDVAIDQGGCSATSVPTTHASPVYIKYGVIHYCVMNVPSNAARTATLALNNATIGSIMLLAENGCEEALKRDNHLRNGLNVYYDKITNREVARSLGYQFHSPESVLRII